MSRRIILFNLIVCITILSTASAQQDTTERFIAVGNLRFRDFNKNGKLDVYEDYRKPVEQRAQDLLSKMTMEEKLVQLQSPWEGKTKIFTENKFDRDKAIRRFPNGLGEITSLNHGSYIFPLAKTPPASQVAVL